MLREIVRLVFCVFAAALAMLPTVAQDTGDRLSTVLERVSFDGPATADELGPALAALGPAEWARLCDLLLAPGAGDDSRPRLALRGLTCYVATPAGTTHQEAYVNTLCAALAKDRPPAVKSFLVQELRLLGSAASVPTLARLLADEELFDHAVEALLAIGGPEAGEALRTAHAQAQGRRRIALVVALGLLRDAAALPQLAADARQADGELRQAALAALANIGAPEALPTGGAFPADSRFAQAQEAALRLRHAQRLAEGGQKEAALAALRALYDAPAEAVPLAVRCAALHGLAGIQGPDAAGLLVAALGDERGELRAAAAEFAVALPGPEVTAALVARLPAAPPAVRAALLTVLARRGDETAFPATIAALQDPDKTVRMAAAAAVGRLGQARAIDPLVVFLDRDDAEERQAAKNALVGLKDRWPSALLARALAGTPPRVRTALLEILAQRRAAGQIHQIFEQTTAADEDVRVAAINALEVVAGERAAPRILQLLQATQSDRERAALEAALAATGRRASNLRERAAPLLAALDPRDATMYQSLLRVLGRVGGPGAIDALRPALRDERAAVRETAFGVLLEWSDPEAADAVLAIARQLEELEPHVRALHAYVRLVALHERYTPRQMLAMYDEAMPATRRVDEKRLLVAKMGEVPDRRALERLEWHLKEEPELREECAAAIVAAADRLLPEFWADVRPALEKALAATQDQATRSRAGEVFQRLAQVEDFITSWQVCGPYTHPDHRGNALLDVVFPPEQTPAPGVAWRQQPKPASAVDYWYVDLNLNADFAGLDRAAYLRTRIYSPTTQAAVLEVGSDDGVKMWLNGQLVHRHDVVRRCARGQDQVPVTLTEGWNHLLLKLTNAEGDDWAACLRVRTPDGGRPAGVQAKAPGEP